MRRLVQHALVGVGFVAVVTSAAVAGLGSPAAESTAVAVPVVSVPSPVSTPSSSVQVEDAATRAAREAEETRSATRNRLIAASTQAGQRAAALEQQSRAIAAQRTKIKAEQQAKVEAAKKRAADAEAAAAKAAAAAATAEAAEKAMNEQGYKPGTTDPREIARQILKNKFDYGDDQYSCFNNIIIRESNWRVSASNPSGAYGIPQAKPGSKMASAGSDWRTNPATQITWGIQYMDDRYGSPCQAWTFKKAHGWY